MFVYIVHFVVVGFVALFIVNFTDIVIIKFNGLIPVLPKLLQTVSQSSLQLPPIMKLLSATFAFLSRNLIQATNKPLVTNYP